MNRSDLIQVSIFLAIFSMVWSLAGASWFLADYMVTSESRSLAYWLVMLASFLLHYLVFKYLKRIEKEIG